MTVAHLCSRMLSRVACFSPQYNKDTSESEAADAEEVQLPCLAVTHLQILLMTLSQGYLSATAWCFICLARSGLSMPRIQSNGPNLESHQQAET